MLGYALQLGAGRYLAVPAHIFSPGPSKYLGSFAFLTFHTNVIGLLYFVLCTASAADASSAAIDALLMQLFPLIFALGIFLTAAYYALEYPNEQNRMAKRKLFKQGYRHVYLTSHLEHIFAGPLTLVYACSIRRDRLQPNVLLPTSDDANLYVGAFLIYYLALTLGNKAATGCWVYPIFQDVSDAGGPVALCLFMFAIIVTGICLAHVGVLFVSNQNGL